MRNLITVESLKKGQVFVTNEAYPQYQINSAGLNTVEYTMHTETGSRQMCMSTSCFVRIAGLRRHNENQYPEV